MEKQHLNKLCFLCGEKIVENDRISINSLSSGYKFNIKQRLNKFISSGITNLEEYDLKIIHSSCESEIENELNKTCGDFNTNIQPLCQKSKKS